MLITLHPVLYGYWVDVRTKDVSMVNSERSRFQRELAELVYRPGVGWERHFDVPGEHNSGTA